MDLQNFLNKYFDKVFIISFVKNFNERIRISNELNSLGITDFEFIYIYDFDNNIIHHPNKLSPKHFSVSFQHYNLMKISKYLNYNRILVFEDDVVFIKNNLLFKEILIDGLNSKSDIILYDYLIIEANDIKTIQLQSAYAVNQNGMNFYIKNFEKNPFIIDQYIYYYRDDVLCDYVWHDILKLPIYLDDDTLNTTIYTTKTRLCYQQNILYHDIDKDKYFNIDN